MIRFFVAAVPFAMLLAACGANDADDAQADDEKSADAAAVSRDNDGRTTTTKIEAEGGTATMRSGPGAAIELPLGFGIYPGSEVVSSTSFAQGKNKGALVTFTSEASSDELVAFYRRAGDKAGFDSQLDQKTDNTRIIGGKRPDGSLFSFSVVPGAEGKLQGQLSISDES